MSRTQGHPDDGMISFCERVQFDELQPYKMRADLPTNVALSGLKRTWLPQRKSSANDPKRALASGFKVVNFEQTRLVAIN